jgi:phage-related protein
VVGTWRITEMDRWDHDAIELLGSALLEFRADGTGTVGFIAVEGYVDWKPDAGHATERRRSDDGVAGSDATERPAAVARRSSRGTGLTHDAPRSHARPMSNRRWRDYRTAAGRRPVKDFLDGLTDTDAAAVVAAMKEVQADGPIAARHLRGEIYEVRADGDRQAFRILFAPEGKSQQVLLALEGISKKTQKTPPEVIRVAERRLADWRRRARP